MARTLGVGALGTVPALVEFGAPPMFWGDFFGRALRRPRDFGPAAAAVLRARSPVAWGSLLRVMRLQGYQPDLGLMLTGLGASSAEIRRETCWHLALALAGGFEPPEALRAQIDQFLQASPPSPEQPVDGFVRDLLARALGSAGGNDASWLSSLREDQWLGPRLGETNEHPIARRFTAAEREAIAARPQSSSRPEASHRVDLQPRDPPSRPEARRVPASEHKGSARTAWGFPPGFVSSVLDEAGCRPTSALVAGAAELTFGPDLRPTNIAFFKQKSTLECDGGRSRPPDHKSSSGRWRGLP